MMLCLRLCKQASPQLGNCVRHLSKLNSELLLHRGAVEVVGRDAKMMLQSLATNDFNCLSIHKNSMYTMFLNTQGRILNDTIVYRVNAESENDGERFVLECDSHSADELVKHLKKHALRRKVRIQNASQKLRTVVLYPDPDDSCNYDWLTSSGSNSQHEGSKQHTIALQAVESTAKSAHIYEPSTINLSAVPTVKLLAATSDPRLSSLAHRLLLDCEQVRTAADSERLLHALLQNTHVRSRGYRSRRFITGISEGASEHESGVNFPLEFNAALLNGVSFTKGCYLGQELTARTHHTGVIRKRIVPVQVADDALDGASGIESTLKQGDAVVLANGTKAGRLVAFDGRVGLALIRLVHARDSQLLIKAAAPQTKDTRIRCSIPSWWPPELRGDVEGEKSDRSVP